MEPLVLPVIFAFAFGAIIGSFLNVVSLRFNTGVGLHGRSKCMSCGTTLTWRELVPIFSFLAQKGACRKCKSKISWQYPLVEIAAGIVFVLIIFRFPPLSALAAVTTLIHLLAACLLLVISAYDAKHKIIPDKFVWAFNALALVSIFVGGTAWIHVPDLWMLAAGPIIAAPFATLWIVSGGRWMGLGDAKLALGIGWFLGLNGGVNALILAFWIAAAVSVVWMLISYGRVKRGVEIPFGPYLILGMYIVLLSGLTVLDVDTLVNLFRV